jgi:hypothetical protein
MPTKLESLKEEQKRLSKRKQKTNADDKRLQQLSQLIRSEERKGVDRLAGEVRSKAGSRISKWDDSKRVETKDGQKTLIPKTTAMIGAGFRKVAGANVGYGMSANQKMRKDQIREALGLGSALESKGFLNADYTENADGSETFSGYSESSMFRDFRFGPGGPAAQRAGSSLTGRTLTHMTGMSVRDVMEFYASLNEDELVRLQTELMDAGLFGKSTPQLGYRDANTAEALSTLMVGWAQNPDKGLPQILADLKAKNAASMREAITEKYGAGTGVISDEVANISVTDTDTLASLADRISVELLGQQLDPERKAALVKQIQDEEKQYKVGQAQTGFSQDVAKAKQQQAAQGGGGPSEIDAFIGALIGQESGGDPNVTNVDSGAMGLGQIMPENWGPWAAEAGVDSRDFSPANQMRVIKHKIAQYYEAYGNWRDVAVAWYGGAGGVQRIRAGGGYNDEDGYPSLHEYANSVLAKMNTSTGAALNAPANEPQLSVNVTEDLGSDEARIRARLMREEPLRYAATGFARQADGFFSLLRGVN